MMRKGIVVEVHPEDHSVDLVMADDGSRLVGVQVMTSNGSTRSGSVDLPEIPKRKNKWDISQATGQDMHAIVGFIGRNPVVTGFIFPQVNQMTSTDPKLSVTRHQSDVMTTIDGDGNIQIAHPSGLFLRIGAAPEKTDYTKKNADASLAVDRNTSSTPYVRLSMAGGKAVLTISPAGDVTLTTETTVDVTAKGAATIKAASIKLDTPETHITGNVTIDGSTTLKAITSNDKDISSTHRHLNSGGAGTGGVPS